MAEKPAAASGVFVVDLSGLNLPKGALQKIEKSINATVEKELGGLDLRTGFTIPPRPIWQGIWVIPKINLPSK